MSDRFDTLYEQYKPSSSASKFDDLYDQYAPAKPKTESPLETKTEASWWAVPEEAAVGTLRGAGIGAGMAVAGAGRAFSDLTGIDEDIVGLVSKGERIRRAAESTFPVTPGMEDSYTRMIAEGVGSTVPGVGAALLGGPPGIAAYGGAVGYEDAFHTAKQLGATDDDAKMYARAGGLVGAVTEPIGGELVSLRILRRADKATGGWLGKQIVKAATGEALEESIQELPNEVARQAYIADRNLWDGVKTVAASGALGGTVGLIVGGMSAAPAMLKAYRESSGSPLESPRSDAGAQGFTVGPPDPADAAAYAKSIGAELVEPDQTKPQTKEQTDGERTTPRPEVQDDAQVRQQEEGKASETRQKEASQTQGEAVLGKGNASEWVHEPPAAAARSNDFWWREEAGDQGQQIATARALADRISSTIELYKPAETNSAIYKVLNDLSFANHMGHEPWTTGKITQAIYEKSGIPAAHGLHGDLQNFATAVEVAKSWPNTAYGMNPKDALADARAVAKAVADAIAASESPRLSQPAAKPVDLVPAIRPGAEAAAAPDTPVAEALQQQTAVPTGAARAFAPGMAPTGQQPHAYFPRQEIADEFERTRGIQRETLPAKIKRWAEKIAHVATRPQEYLAQNETNASFNEFFRLLKTIPDVVRDESTRTIGAITGGLGNKADQNAFSDYLILRNQLAALDRGEPLRHPFESRAEVEQSLSNLDAIIRENPAIANAIEQRTAVVKELTGQLVQEGILPKSAADNAENYFHQQVLMYAEAERQFGSTKPTERKKGFQKRRTQGEYLGQEYAYNKDYIESEFRWMTDAHALLRLKKMLREYIEPADIKARLDEQAKQVGGDKTWKDFIPEGYEVWQPRPGRTFFKAISVPERIYDAILDGSISEMEVDESTFKTVLALGRPYRQMVLPEDLVKELKATEKTSPQGGFVEGIDRLLVAAQSAWKGWVTAVSPKRFLSYNIRNAVGDGDAVLGGAPGVFTEIPNITRDLWAYWRGDIAVTPQLKKWRDLGILDSGFTAQEAPDLKELPAFERFYDANLKDLPARALRGYYGTLRKYTNFRESLMRVAAAERYAKLLRSGDLSSFGASNKKVIKALMKAHGADVAAAKLARDLLGDYGNRTVLGKFLASRILPFWSFQEINMQRYPRMALNALTTGDVKTLAALPVSAAYRMILLSRMAWLFTALWLWNNMFRPDEEKDNERWVRQNPHLNIGRRPDGSTIVFNNLGAFGELMEWFGINSMLGLKDLVDSGQITVPQLLQEAAKDPVNKLVQSVRPDLKLGAEMATGQSTFPDVFAPRSTDPLTSFANVFGLVDEMNAAKGKLLQQGDRARPNYLARLLTVVTDPRQSSLHEIYDLRSRFLESKGKERPPSFAGDPLMRNMRQAAMNNDREAFDEARRAYIKSGKQWKNFKASLAYLDPIANRLNDADENEFVSEYLTPVQRERLKVARDYAAEIRDTLTTWWFEEEDAR